MTTIPLASAHRTILHRDEDYNAYVKNHKANKVSPIGIRYSDIYRISNTPTFRAFERANKATRRGMFVGGKIGLPEIRVQLYKIDLLHRKERQIMDEIDVGYFHENALSPLLKWPGGKTNDLKQIRDRFSYLLPKSIRNYYEPFLGGGAVWLSLHGPQMYVNDICDDLISFYRMVQTQDHTFFDCISRMTENWELLAKIIAKKHKKLYTSSDEEKRAFLEEHRDALEDSFFAPKYAGGYFDVLLSSLISKTRNIQRVENKRGTLTDGDLAQNIEGALKAGFYTYVRDIYNKHKKLDALKAACFYFLRDYCFSSMFRYNADGDFNVPYGGMSYNSRPPSVKVDYWKDPTLVSHLKSTTFCNEDFETFLTKHSPSHEDFIFVDPPYDSEFSTYAKNTFGPSEQERLADYLVNGCDAKFLAIMKNTDFIRNLYEGKKKDIQCLTFDKTYAVSFKNRNSRDVEHLIVSRL